MSATDAPSFSPDLFAFLRELAKNNERGWFKANKARYEEQVKEPALAFSCPGRRCRHPREAAPVTGG